MSTRPSRESLETALESVDCDTVTRREEEILRDELLALQHGMAELERKWQTRPNEVPDGWEGSSDAYHGWIDGADSRDMSCADELQKLREGT